MNMEKKLAYEEYVGLKTPKNNVFMNMLKAFLVGGAICMLGQGIFNFAIGRGESEDMAALWTSLSLVLFSVLLTGLNIYQRIAQWGGAGALVPITGFANSVASPAIEYQKDERDIIGLSRKDP